MKDIPVYYIPGNHDIGYAGGLTRMPKVARVLLLNLGKCPCLWLLV